MLTKRIIPCLDVDQGRVVKGVSFVNLRDAGDPVELAKFYNDEGADEIVFLDITASSSQRKTIVDVVERVSAEIFIPLTVGGGIRTITDIREMLESGADKVSINTAAISDPKLINNVTTHYGAQCIVLAIDAKRIVAPFVRDQGNVRVSTDIAVDEDSIWEVYSHGGRVPTGIDVLKWSKFGNQAGIGEILLTSMDMDGQQEGYDLPLLKTVSDSVNVPVIASGGAGELSHLSDGVLVGKADAILAASIFHFGTYSIRQVKEYLSTRGIETRPVASQ